MTPREKSNALTAGFLILLISFLIMPLMFSLANDMSQPVKNIEEQVQSKREIYQVPEGYKLIKVKYGEKGLIGYSSHYGYLLNEDFSKYQNNQISSLDLKNKDGNIDSSIPIGQIKDIKIIVD